MEKEKSISTGDSLIKTCTCLLDAIYSSHDCVQFITTLQLIEKDLSNNHYESVDSFKKDIVGKIPQISRSYVDSIDLSHDCTLPEEYANTPIYSSITLRKESKMYTVNIKTHQKLHSSIYDAIETPSKQLHRLYIMKDRDTLLEAKDSVYSILSLFFNVKVLPHQDDPNISCIKAKVAVVHPLGEYHPTRTNEFDGWIKVKIVQTNSINTRIPTKLAHRLFGKRQQLPNKILFKSSTDKESGLFNELTRQFINTVMDSHSEGFEKTDSLPAIENLLNNKTKSKHTPCKANSDPKSIKSTVPLLSSSKTTTLPNLYQSSSKMMNLLDSTKTTLSAPISNNRSNLTKSSLKPVQRNTTTPYTNSISSPKPIFDNFWKILEKFCHKRDTNMVHKNKYDIAFKRNMDASGFFKHVYFTKDNDVLQVFQRSTASQRVIEIVSLLALKDKPCIGRIKEVIHNEKEVIGLTMDRYEMTLKEYLQKHTHHRLTAEQRMHIIVQMLESINVSHQAGIAHRDLSTVNFMINSDAKLFLIDFGKAVFFFARDAKKWWVESDDIGLYTEDVKPSSREELAVWCRSLPYVMARPDHGYRFYRSIQTLPKSHRDRDFLPHLIDPAAEDIYSLGTIIWKIFSGMEPWPGVFDTDLKKLRETVSKDDNIDRMLDKSMPGPVSKKFLKMFLRVEAKHRSTAADILNWIHQKGIKEALINEWSATNGSRRTAARNNVHCRATTTIPEPVGPKIKIKLAADSTNANDKPRRVGRPRNSVKTDKPDNAPKRPVGRPRKTTISEGPLELHPFEKSSIPSLRLPRLANSKAEKNQTYVITSDGVKRFAKSGVPVGRPKPAIDRKTTIVKSECTEPSPNDHGSDQKPTIKKHNPYYKYVPTGKPRGRPRKYPRKTEVDDSVKQKQQRVSEPELEAPTNCSQSSTSQDEQPSTPNSSVINTQSNTSTTEKTVPSASKENSTDVVKNKSSDGEENHIIELKKASRQVKRSVDEELEMQPSTSKRRLSILEENNAEPIASKEKSRRKLFIKLPEQPRKLLNRETIQLVGRGALNNVRGECNKPSPHGFPKRPTSTAAMRHFSKEEISPPSPQSPALSPVSNTETVEEIASPTSPVPNKRKFECEHEKATKRQYVPETNESGLRPDDFDLALFNVLQGLGIDSNNCR